LSAEAAVARTGLSLMVGRPVCWPGWRRARPGCG